eukprot:TRINITY_DN950_c1_g1_i1.p1 TRINITY_DN950_c1_g1~~TRINITY_DN950_c1_g1_i1.p1  ORF type:complete len:2000 (+),score=703.01 TRINITY_DN950_c1_g1_i1:63-6062(+)
MAPRIAPRAVLCALERPQWMRKGPGEVQALLKGDVVEAAEKKYGDCVREAPGVAGFTAAHRYTPWEGLQEWLLLDEAARRAWAEPARAGEEQAGGYAGDGVSTAMLAYLLMGGNPEIALLRWISMSSVERLAVKETDAGYAAAEKIAAKLDATQLTVYEVAAMSRDQLRRWVAESSDVATAKGVCRADRDWAGEFAKTAKTASLYVDRMQGALLYILTRKRDLALSPSAIMKTWLAFTPAQRRQKLEEATWYERETAELLRPFLTSPATAESIDHVKLTLSSRLRDDKQVSLMKTFFDMRTDFITRDVAFAAIELEGGAVLPESGTTGRARGKRAYPVSEATPLDAADQAFLAKVDKAGEGSLARVWVHAMCASHTSLEEAFDELGRSDRGELGVAEAKGMEALTRTVRFKEQEKTMQGRLPLLRTIGLADSARVLWHLAHARRAGVYPRPAPTKLTQGRLEAQARVLDGPQPPPRLPEYYRVSQHFPYERFRQGMGAVPGHYVESLWNKLSPKESAGFERAAEQEGVPSAAAFLFTFGAVPSACDLPLGFEAYATKVLADAGDAGHAPEATATQLAQRWLELPVNQRRQYVSVAATLREPERTACQQLPMFSSSPDLYGAPGLGYFMGSTDDWPLLTDGEKFAYNAKAGLGSFKTLMARHADATLYTYFANTYYRACDKRGKHESAGVAVPALDVTFQTVRRTPERRATNALGFFAAYDAWRAAGASGFVFPNATLPDVRQAWLKARVEDGVDMAHVLCSGPGPLPQFVAQRLAACSAGAPPPPPSPAGDARGGVLALQQHAARGLQVVKALAKKKGAVKADVGPPLPAPAPQAFVSRLKAQLRAAKERLARQATSEQAALQQTTQEDALAAIEGSVQAAKIEAARLVYVHEGAPAAEELTVDDFRLASALTTANLHDAVADAAASAQKWTGEELFALRHDISAEDLPAALADADRGALGPGWAPPDASKHLRDVTQRVGKDAPKRDGKDAPMWDWRPRSLEQASAELAALFGVKVPADRPWMVLTHVLAEDAALPMRVIETPHDPAAAGYTAPVGLKVKAVAAALLGNAPDDAATAPEADAGSAEVDAGSAAVGRLFWMQRLPRGVQQAVLSSLHGAWGEEGQHRLAGCRLAYSEHVAPGSPGEAHFITRMLRSPDTSPLAASLAKELWQAMGMGERKVYEHAALDQEARVRDDSVRAQDRFQDTVFSRLREALAGTDLPKGRSINGLVQQVEADVRFWAESSGVEREWALVELPFRRFNPFTAAAACTGVPQRAMTYAQLQRHGGHPMITNLHLLPRRTLDDFAQLPVEELRDIVTRCGELNAEQEKAHKALLKPLGLAQRKKGDVQRLAFPIFHFLLERGARDATDALLREYARLAPYERAKYIVEARKFHHVLTSVRVAVNITGQDVFFSETRSDAHRQDPDRLKEDVTDWKTLADHRKQYYERQAALLTAPCLRAEDVAGPQTAFGVMLSCAPFARMTQAEAEEHFYNVAHPPSSMNELQRARNVEAIKPYEAEASRNRAWLRHHQLDVAGVPLGALEDHALKRAASVPELIHAASVDAAHLSDAQATRDDWAVATAEEKEEAYLGQATVYSTALKLARPRDVPGDVMMECPEDEERAIPASVRGARIKAFAEEIVGYVLSQRDDRYRLPDGLYDFRSDEDVLEHELCMRGEQQAFVKYDYAISDEFLDYLRQRRFTAGHLIKELTGWDVASSGDVETQRNASQTICDAEISTRDKLRFLAWKLEEAALRGDEADYNFILPKVAAYAAEMKAAGGKTTEKAEPYEEEALARYFMKATLTPQQETLLREHWRPITDPSSFPLYEHARLRSSLDPFDVYRVAHAEMSSDTATAEAALRKAWEGLTRVDQMPYIMASGSSRDDFQTKGNLRQMISDEITNQVPIITRVKQRLLSRAEDTAAEDEAKPAAKRTGNAKLGATIEAFETQCAELPRDEDGVPSDAAVREMMRGFKASMQEGGIIFADEDAGDTLKASAA